MEDKKINFAWQGKDKNGNKTQGVITATSTLIARVSLRQSGIEILQIAPVAKPLLTARPKKIHEADIIIATRSLATMLGSGIPLAQSLAIIGKGHKNPSVEKLLLQIKADIESGNTLTDSLAKYPTHFDQIFCSLVAAGEQAGALEVLLNKIAHYREKSAAVKEKVKKVMIYPAIVSLTAIGVGVLLLVFVVPIFEELFADFGADLPWFTRQVIAMCEWLQEYGWQLLGAVSVVVLAGKIANKRSAKFHRFVDSTLLKMPIVGQIIRKNAIARFTRTLAILLAAGVPLLDGLRSTAGTCGNILYHDATTQIRKQIADGDRLQQAMARFDLFPHLVVQMVAVGEESGALDTMLNKIADIFEQEIDDIVDKLGQLIEPVIILTIGVFVGGLIVAMYLPIFQLGTVIG